MQLNAASLQAQAQRGCHGQRGRMGSGLLRHDKQGALLPDLLRWGDDVVLGQRRRHQAAAAASARACRAKPGATNRQCGLAGQEEGSRSVATLSACVRGRGNEEPGVGSPGVTELLLSSHPNLHVPSHADVLRGRSRRRSRPAKSTMLSKSASGSSRMEKQLFLRPAKLPALAPLEGARAKEPSPWPRDLHLGPGTLHRGAGAGQLGGP